MPQCCKALSRPAAARENGWTWPFQTCPAGHPEPTTRFHGNESGARMCHARAGCASATSRARSDLGEPLRRERRLEQLSRCSSCATRSSSSSKSSRVTRPMFAKRSSSAPLVRSPTRDASARQRPAMSSMIDAGLLAAHAAAGRELVGEPVGALGRQRDRPDRSQPELSKELAQRAGVHRSRLARAAVGPRAPALPALLAPAVGPRRRRPPRRRRGSSARAPAPARPRQPARPPPAPRPPRAPCGTTGSAALRRAYSGSRSLRIVSSGAAMKIVE